MTIDEAIKERQKVIEVQEKLYKKASTNESKEIIKSATDNDRQLVEWLRKLKEAKRLLQLAWDDIQTLNDVTVDDEGNCLIEDKFESCTECPLFCESKRYCGWRYQVDALMLIGETNADQ